jgi:hypothetical protein
MVKDHRVTLLPAASDGGRRPVDWAGRPKVLAANPFSPPAIWRLTVRSTRSRTPLHVGACKPHVR